MLIRICPYRKPQMRLAPKLQISAPDLKRLQDAQQNLKLSERHLLRVRIILMACDGTTNQQIAKLLNCSRRTVGFWRQRVYQHGVDSVLKQPARPGRKPSRRREVEVIVMDLLRHSRPPRGVRWTIRTLASRTDVSKDTILRILRENEIDLKNRQVSETQQTGMAFRETTIRHMDSAITT